MNTQPGLVLILETSEGILGKERGWARICRTDCDLSSQLYGTVCVNVCVCVRAAALYPCVLNSLAVFCSVCSQS